METKHTPGPWNIGLQTKTRIQIMSNSGTYPCVATATKYKDEYGMVADTESYANARLIAAAPDLLEVLVELEDLLSVKDVKYHGNPSLHAEACKENRRKMKAIIAKATGEGA